MVNFYFYHKLIKQNTLQINLICSIPFCSKKGICKTAYKYPRKLFLFWALSFYDVSLSSQADEMICEMKVVLKDVMSHVLEAEMKEAFDDLW